MKIRAVLHHLGLFLMGLGILMGIPLACSFYYHEPDKIPFLVSIGITVGSGLILWLIPYPKTGRFSRREALLLVAGIWVLASAFGALPYQLAGVFPGYLDAYFETMSGFTTTGASVLKTIEVLPHGILLWRNFTQWLGGMGIVVLFVAVFPLMGVGAAHMAESEMTGLKAERMTARIRDTARIMWQIYVGLSVVEVVALLLAGLPFFESLLTMLGTMPTGGFHTRDLSIGAYNNVCVEGIVTFFMVAAGANFQLYYFVLWKHEARRFLADTELRAYISILAVASILIGLDLMANMGYSAGTAFRYSIFQSASIQTTTGFATADFARWPAFSQLILLILMLIGASACSTSGALKVIRIVVLVKYVYRQLLFFVSPRSVRPMKLGGKVLGERAVSDVVALSALYLLVIAVGFLIMSALGLDIVSALSSATAALGNVGPALGAVGPMANYSFIPGTGKVVLILFMLIGRLELWAVLAIFTPEFWRSR